MIKLYKTVILFTFLSLLILFSEYSSAQCVGGPGGTTVYDTTIFFPTGANHKQVKFPKFNPMNGMVSCVKLIVTMTGVVDTVAMQNYSASAQTANYYYNRNDQMTGPGLTSALSNSFNGNYGPYNLGAFDGSIGTGPDFLSRRKDTVLKKTMSRTLSDSTSISSFYGSDSVVYDYDISVTTSAVMTGGSSSNLVLTSAFVNFRFEYCTCPPVVLPAGLNNFVALKSSANIVALSWQAETDKDNYFYEVEVSRDGQHFIKAETINKKAGAYNPKYQHLYALKNNEYGHYYFRIRQRWANGYVRFSAIRAVDFANPLFATVNLYPNPSTGTVGLKFVNAKPGQYRVQILNAQGQLLISKDIQVAETDYKVITTVQRGLYYIKLADPVTNTAIVHQLIVK